MKWRELTADQLLEIATAIDDRASEMEPDREVVQEEEGFDLVEGMRSVSRFLRRESGRRDNKTKDC